MNEIRKIEKNSAETELSEFKKIKHEYLEEKLLHAINISKTNPQANDPNSPIAKAIKKLEERAAKGLKGIETGEGFYKYK